MRHASERQAERMPTRVGRYMAPGALGGVPVHGTATRRTIHGPGSAALRRRLPSATASAAATAALIAAAGAGGGANPAVLGAAATASVIAAEWIEGHEHGPYPHGLSVPASSTAHGSTSPTHP